jgi:hypothetical protein
MCRSPPTSSDTTTPSPRAWHFATARQVYERDIMRELSCHFQTGEPLDDETVSAVRPPSQDGRMGLVGWLIGGWGRCVAVAAGCARACSTAHTELTLSLTRTLTDSLSHAHSLTHSPRPSPPTVPPKRWTSSTTRSTSSPATGGRGSSGWRCTTWRCTARARPTRSAACPAWTCAGCTSSVAILPSS